MISKLTSELKPGDVVSIFGYRRTIASVTPGEVEGLLRVRFQPIEGNPHSGGHVEPDADWEVDAPSPLDLAVQRAQELADRYDIEDRSAFQALHDLLDLLDLFRAAR